MVGLSAVQLPSAVRHGLRGYDPASLPALNGRSSTSAGTARTLLGILLLIATGCGSDPLQQEQQFWESVGAVAASEQVRVEGRGDQLAIVRVELRRARLTDEMMARLNRLPHLQWLDLFGSNCQDSHLEQLAYFNELQYLNLAETDVTDNGCRFIARYTSLRELALPPATTDRGLVELQKLSRLHTLFLGDTRVRGPGLASLDGLPLKTLRLDRTLIDDPSLRFVARLAQLERLSLAETRISSTGLSPLLELSRLDYLSLANTAVDDDAVPILSEFKELVILELPNTRLTPTGLLRLERALPNTQVAFVRDDLPTWWPDPEPPTGEEPTAGVSPINGIRPH